MKAATNQAQKARKIETGHLALRPRSVLLNVRATVRGQPTAVSAQLPPGAPRGPLPYFSTTFWAMRSASSQVTLEPMTIETVLPDGASTNSETAPDSAV